jgi:hypothetical protein
MEKFIDLVIGKMFYDLGVEYRLILKILTEGNYITIEGGMIVRLDSAVTPHEEMLGKTQGKVHAVKAYKERTGMRLMPSKIAIEKHFADHNLEFFVYRYNG